MKIEDIGQRQLTCRDQQQWLLWLVYLLVLLAIEREGEREDCSLVWINNNGAFVLSSYLNLSIA